MKLKSRLQAGFFVGAYFIVVMLRLMTTRASCFARPPARPPGCRSGTSLYALSSRGLTRCVGPAGFSLNWIQ